ncbi:MAG: sulfotransferase domain-containing protein [Pseudomonadota bacterium]
MNATQKTLIWLASYPKSGNTWLRAFLANYLFDTDGPATFEHVQRVSSGDCSRPSYEELARGNPDDLKPGPFVKLRHQHLGRIAGNGAPVNFVKTHAPYRQLSGQPLIPPWLTRSAIYMIRHPLDMLVSYADHWGVDHGHAARMIADKRNAVGPSPKTVAQYLGNWSDHVKSWRDTRDIPVLVIRYEDMLADPHAAFTQVLDHMQAPIDGAVLDQAIKHASFESLVASEAAGGFPERGPHQTRFFREGRTGTGREVLPPEIVDKVLSDHRSVMEKHGYA